MRIHLNLPSSSAGSSSSASTSSAAALLASAPSPLTALTPNGELILIELQGSLEIENQSPAGGQVLGTISFEPTRLDRPVLMISHHRLEGKFVNLVRPLAVLEKKKSSADATKPEAEAVLVDVVNGSNGKRKSDDHDGEVGQQVGTVKRAKPLSDRNAFDGDSSPPPTFPLSSPRRPARDALDFSSSPPHQTPIKPRPVAKASQQLRDIDENGTTTDRNPGEQDEDEDEEGEGEGEEEAQTAIYYDVVNVIKRKILFSKRPEPIVRLDSSTTTPTAAGSKPQDSSRH